MKNSALQTSPGLAGDYEQVREHIKQSELLAERFELQEMERLLDTRDVPQKDRGKPAMLHNLQSLLRCLGRQRKGLMPGPLTELAEVAARHLADTNPY